MSSQYETRRYFFKANKTGEVTEIQGFGWDDLANEAERLGLVSTDVAGVQFDGTYGWVFRPWGKYWRSVGYGWIERTEETT